MLYLNYQLLAPAESPLPGEPQLKYPNYII